MSIRDVAAAFHRDHVQVVRLQVAATDQSAFVTAVDPALDGEVAGRLDGRHADGAVDDDVLGRLDMKTVEDVPAHGHVAEEVDVSRLEIQVARHFQMLLHREAAAHEADTPGLDRDHPRRLLGIHGHALAQLEGARRGWNTLAEHIQPILRRRGQLAQGLAGPHVDELADLMKVDGLVRVVAQRRDPDWDQPVDLFPRLGGRALGDHGDPAVPEQGTRKLRQPCVLVPRQSNLRAMHQLDDVLESASRGSRALHHLDRRRQPVRGYQQQ